MAVRDGNGRRRTVLAVLAGLAGFGAANAQFAGPDQATLSYSLLTAANVSVAIYDREGGIVRQLLLAEPRDAGEHTEKWDGLDDRGRPAAAAGHTWKLLSSQGLKAEWVVSLGTNLTPGWQIMPGNHVGAVRVALDAAGDLYIMGGCSECVPGMVRISPDGQRRWASDHLLESNNDCGVGLAGGKLFSLLGNAKVIAIDPETGKGLWKTATDWHDVKEQWKPGSTIIQLAARGEQLVVSHKSSNAVQWLDPADGKVLDRAVVAAPQAVAVDGGGRVLAISGDTVVRLSRAAKAPVGVLTGLTAPHRLAVDPVTGEIFVAEAGESRRVKRFSAAGRLLATYGRPGGRQFGRYEPRDFRGITGLATDGKGGFIVVEAGASPRRVAWFDTNGDLVREWYGGLHYANGGAADPADPSLVWYHSGSGEVVQARIDYVRKRYDVLATYQLIGIGDGIIGNINGYNAFMVRHMDGHTYLVAQEIEPRIVRVDEANRRLVPVVAGKYFMLHDFLNPPYTPRAFVKAYFGGTVPADPKYGQIPDAANREAAMWTDLNNDGMPQSGEIVFSSRRLMTWACGRIWADESMNLYEMNDRPMVWRPQRWTGGGVPLYGGWSDWEPVGEPPPWFDPLKVTWPAGSGVIPLPQGGFMGFFNNTENPFGKGIGSDGIGGNYIVRWDADGKPLWVTGRHSPDFGAAPGEGRFLWNIAGLAHGCIVVTDMQCYYTIKNLVHVWDSDGLWVGRLLENPDLDAAPQEAYHLATENFGGTLVEITEQNRVAGLNAGDVVFMGCGQNVTSVYRVTGWGTFARQDGSIALTPAQSEAAKSAAFAAAAIKAGSGKRSRIKKHVAAPLPRLATAPTLDGKLDDPVWQTAGRIDDFRIVPAEEAPEPAPTTVFVGFDDTNLYVAIRCTEPAMDSLRAVGSPLHLDDSVELFIDRTCSRSRYYQVMVNPNATTYVGLGWTARPEVKIDARASREADAWTVEMAIPWTAIEAEPPAAGERLGFNVVRNRVGGGEWHSNWSPLCGNLNHSPAYFGTLYVGDTLPRQAAALIAGRAFVRNLNAAAMSVDGSLADWQGVNPLRIADGATPVADVYLGWREDGLYAAFDVTTAAPWRNASALDMAFNGGAACDLNVGPCEQDRLAVVRGDVRYIVAPLDGTATVVEFLPKLTQDLGADDSAPRTYHTDAQGDSVFERVALLADGPAAAMVKPDGKGYVVEMRVPLRAPLELTSGSRFAFDASVLLADPAGTRTQLRLPWFSISGDDMFVATDVVIESSLRPANWGIAELE